MKKLFLLLLIAPVFGFSQGEQRYADGTATDQDGNTFEWINYGTQDWAIENAEVETYRDGTEIPQVTDATEWSNLTTGAWCYYDNDPTKGKLYNWYAVMGIHDNDENTSNKELAPEGWHVPKWMDWVKIRDYLIANGYNYDQTTSENKIAKAMASISEWNNSTTVGAVGNEQTLNNSSGFNAFPVGQRSPDGSFLYEGIRAAFWGFPAIEPDKKYSNILNVDIGSFNRGIIFYDGQIGFSIRFDRDASAASTNKYSNAITLYPNPTTSKITLQGDKEYDIEVYTLQGKKVMALTGNTIDMSHLSSATYIVKALDKVENEEVSYKVVKN
jgi:uncharacterized protein (TIGR02145 family)